MPHNPQTKAEPGLTLRLGVALAEPLEHMRQEL
jgi:hypothetical protein